ncbi:MAG TPA: glycosyltransferase family 1 protein, partial [Candidatus Dormibacteraeota bacterium]|nr:glycosyltransferase family 1 protein [Candidatus Dormibacteraeota bacterium]
LDRALSLALSRSQTRKEAGRGAPGPRVLLDARPLQGPSARRGVGSYANGLLRGLIDEGFASNLTLLLDSDLPVPPLPVGEYRLASSRRRYRGQLAAYEEAVVLGSDLGRIGPDLYHAIDLKLPGRSPVPLVVTLHDLIPWAWGGPRMRGERLRFWLGRRFLKRADLVLAVSKATAGDATRLSGVDPKRIRVVPEAAGDEFKPRPGAADRVHRRWGLAPGYLLFVGALDARKDPDALLRAWRVACDVGADVDLVIAGEPGRQAPKNMGAAHRLGHVDDAELADLYAAAGCLLFPSRYEGFGLPCLEAMACGCPVAAFRNSSVVEVLDGVGELVPDGDADALGRAAATLTQDPERARRLGVERAKAFSWRKTARQTIGAYESLLGDGARLR